MGRNQVTLSPTLNGFALGGSHSCAAIVHQYISASHLLLFPTLMRQRDFFAIMAI